MTSTNQKHQKKIRDLYSKVFYPSVPPLPRAARLLALALMIAAAMLLPWLIVLGAVLKGTAEVRMWSSSWIGLDSLEVIGLVTTGVLMLRRNIQVMAAASFTAALFFLDGWFDVMLSQAGKDWYEALALAFFVELPLFLVCIAIAVTAPAWCSRVQD